MTTATGTGGADTTPPGPPGPPGPPKTSRARTRLGDRTFAGAARGAGILILLVLAGVAGFLLIEAWPARSEEHTSELQSRGHLVCRLLLEKKNRSKTSAK